MVEVVYFDVIINIIILLVKEIFMRNFKLGSIWIIWNIWLFYFDLVYDVLSIFILFLSFLCFYKFFLSFIIVFWYRDYYLFFVDGEIGIWRG